MRLAGMVLLWLGILGGSFIAVRDPAEVAWSLYAGACAVGIVGVVLLRISARATAGQGAKVQAELSAMRESLATLRAALKDTLEQRAGVYRIKGVIDAAFAPELACFADAREAMIPAFGLQGYADVMTRFAAAERMINRAWSASADGYVDEVWLCLERADGLLDEAHAAFTKSDRAG